MTDSGVDEVKKGVRETLPPSKLKLGATATSARTQRNFPPTQSPKPGRSTRRKVLLLQRSERKMSVKISPPQARKLHTSAPKAHPEVPQNPPAHKAKIVSPSRLKASRGGALRKKFATYGNKGLGAIVAKGLRQSTSTTSVSSSQCDRDTDGRCEKALSPSKRT